MQVKVEKQPKSTIQVSVTVPNSKVKEAYSKVLEKVVTGADLPGFRKGQAPKNMVEEKTNPSDLYGDVVNELLETYYPQAIKENKISPISNPKIEIKEFELDKDFEFVATIAVRPDIKIKSNYKAELEKLYKKQKKAFVEANKDNKEADTTHFRLSANEAIKKLVELSNFDVSEVLVEEEVNRMISRIIQQTQALGMSMDDFLKTQDKTVESIKNDYEKTSEENIKAEFILSHLINEEKIEITDAEIDTMIGAVGDETAQKQMQDPMQRWYIKNILAKNKLLEKLLDDIEGKEKNKK
jgi:FKBP-type peptidyl-prolyl cis-trans isomerase (trigger factor)